MDQNAKKNSYKAKISIQSKLSDIDKILDQGGSNEEILFNRSLLLKELNDINSIDSLEEAQKSKVHWAIEGDENTKFFHGILNSKHSQLAVRVTLVDGEWIVDPLYLEQQADLEQNVSNEEIKSAICDCGMNKSPGLDGFTFEFFRRYWKLLEHDIMGAVNFFYFRSIKAIYGEDGALNSPSSLSKRFSWLDIIRGVTVLRTKGINLLDLIPKKVGNGLNTLFWEDPWLDDLALKHKFLRLYALDNYKQLTVVKKINHASMVDSFHRPPRGSAEEEQLGFLLSRMDGLILTNIPDCWVWSLETTREFSVKSVC
ncbi:hypothetical protein Tco_0616592 [Tanacetum coccineum]